MCQSHLFAHWMPVTSFNREDLVDSTEIQTAMGSATKSGEQCSKARLSSRE